MARHVALLRGINVGAHNRIGMPRLREVLTDAGYEDVRTLLASGNVVLGADATPRDGAEGVHACIAEAFGLDIGIVVRSGEELARVVERNPLAGVADASKRYQVTFLA